MWQRKHEPFAPPLKEGKYADRGHMVKALDGRHAGKWGVVTDIKYHQFTVEFEDGNVEVSHGQAGGTRGGGCECERDRRKAAREWAWTRKAAGVGSGY